MKKKVTKPTRREVDEQAAKPEQALLVPRSVYHQKVLELSAARALDLLWVKSRIGAVYEDRAQELRAIVDPARFTADTWTAALNKRLHIMSSTVVEGRRLATFASELVEIAIAVRGLVTGFVGDFREAERELGVGPPRWIVVELAKMYGMSSSARQREWTEFYALVDAALPPGNSLDPTTADNVLRTMVPKIPFSSLYGKFGKAPDVKP